MMGKTLYIIFFCVLTLVFGFAGRKKAVKFDKMDFCEIGPQAPFNVSYLHIRSSIRGSFVDAKIELFRDVQSLWGMAKITRCKHKELLDSCEYFATMKIKKLCPFIAQKNSIMAPLFYGFEPPYICPLRKGTYVLNNGTFDPNLLSVFPLENFYWKVNLYVYESETDIFLYNTCIEGQVIVLRG